MDEHAGDQVAEWLRELPPDSREIVDTLRGMIADRAPDAHEIIYHGALGYGPTDSGFDRIFYVSVFKDHVNLGFFYGAGLPDPDTLLAGGGKQMRHVKIKSPESMPRAALGELLGVAWPAGLARVQARHAPRRRQPAAEEAAAGGRESGNQPPGRR